jgi:hypothetical protein
VLDLLNTRAKTFKQAVAHWSRVTWFIYLLLVEISSCDVNCEQPVSFMDSASGVVKTFMMKGFETHSSKFRVRFDSSPSVIWVPFRNHNISYRVSIKQWRLPNVGAIA